MVRLWFLIISVAVTFGCLSPAKVNDNASAGGRGQIPDNNDEDSLVDGGHGDSNETPAMGEEGGPCYGNGTSFIIYPRSIL